MRILSFLELLIKSLSDGHGIRVVDALVSGLDNFSRFLSWLLLLLLQESANLFYYVVLHLASDLSVESLGVRATDVPLRFSSDCFT